MKAQITKSISGLQASEIYHTLKMKASGHRFFVYALELVVLFMLVFATVSTFAQTPQTAPIAKATGESNKLEFVKQSIVFNGGKVYMNWVVKANSEDCIYVVERSVDGNESEPVGLKERIGSKLGLLYTRVHSNPLTGTAYYPLKRIVN